MIDLSHNIGFVNKTVLEKFLISQWMWGNCFERERGSLSGNIDTAEIKISIKLTFFVFVFLLLF